MEKKKVLSYSNLPSRLPVLHTVVLYILLDFYDAREWVWGVVGVIMCLVWISSAVSLFVTTRVDIFKNDK